MSSLDKKNDPSKAEAVDDLDDLDDILDEFNPTDKPTTAATSNANANDERKVGTAAASASSSSIQPSTASANDKEETEEELNERFAKELAQGMEALMKGIDPETLAQASKATGEGSIAQGEGGKDEEGLLNEEEMMKQFEQMMADMGFGAPGMGGEAGASLAGNASNPSGSKIAAPNAPPANFQDAIKNTMSRLRESDQTATSSAGQADEMDFEKLMAALGSASGAEGEEGVAAMLENMMNELMGKEVLYEPLKELRDKYPDYLANPPQQISAEDRKRYEEQQRIVSEVIKTFDNPKYDNGTESEKSELKSKVHNLMNEMQDQGAPPQEIIGDLPPELGNMPGMGDENCSIM